MELDIFIIMVFCIVDDWLMIRGRLRQRGPHPKLADSEVLTMELVGEFLGLDADTALYAYFRRHYSHFFPALREVHRTTFIRQAANLMGIKVALWQEVLSAFPHGNTPLWRVDSLPMPVCRFARARSCRRFAGVAAFGYDEVAEHAFYGFRAHLCVDNYGFIRAFTIAPANEHDLALVPELVEGYRGVVIGDRNYWSPMMTDELRRSGVTLCAPYKRIRHDPDPARSSLLADLRRGIETVISQLVERYHLKSVRARDLWHLSSRLWRKILSHTLAVWLNLISGHQPLQLEALVSL